MEADFDLRLCIRCKGRGWCGKPCQIYNKLKDFSPKRRIHFSGDSPPEIFVGRFNYPNVRAGVLSPSREELLSTSKQTSEFSMPEIWYEKRLTIDKILKMRSDLIYGRFEISIKSPIFSHKNRLLETMQEISMSHKSVSTEFFLKKPPVLSFDLHPHTPVIGNPAPLQNLRLEENPKILPKVDNLVADTDAKATTSIQELYSSKIPISNIIKILSAGLLGLRTQRKLVPSRWAVTAVDDTISKALLKKIRYYPEINDILLFHEEYNGNHYEILLLPSKFSFEVIEAKMSGCVWNPFNNTIIMQDYEFFYGRKDYASNVTGAYYANRLALTEYLEKIKKQASAIFMREARPEYYAPLGVGILRELCRGAFRKKPEKFSSIKEALEKAQTRLRLPIKIFTSRSVILKEYKKQKRLNEYF